MVHDSVTCPKGHCLCYINDGNGQWHKVDASKVTRYDVTCVLREPAHVLLSIQQTDLKMPRKQCKQGSWPLNTKLESPAEKAQQVPAAVDAQENRATKRNPLNRENASGTQLPKACSEPLDDWIHSASQQLLFTSSDTSHGAEGIRGRTVLTRKITPCHNSARLLSALGEKQRAKRKESERGQRLLVFYSQSTCWPQVLWTHCEIWRQNKMTHP